MQLPKEKLRSLEASPSLLIGTTHTRPVSHEKRDECPKFQAAMEVLAKPWSGILIAALEGGPLRFSELSERVSTIGDRMLALRLRELEARGLVLRTVVSGPPIRVEYSLTEAGHGFREVAEAVQRWGSQILLAKGEGAR
jgi:DNA-binding HxlR family transcriptional regulator